MARRLVPLALLLVAAACTSGPPAPADATEFRERLDEALHGEPGQVLHLEFSLPSIDGGFELDRETWVDWDAGAYRQAYYGSGDEAPLTVVVDGQQYFPPSIEPHPVETDVGSVVLEPLEVLQTPLGILRFTDDRAEIGEAEVDGDRVWRLSQTGVRAIEGGQTLFCLDIQLDIDAETNLPRSFTTAQCGSPLSASYRYAADWLDEDEIPARFFAPETAANIGTAP